MPMLNAKIFDCGKWPYLLWNTDAIIILARSLFISVGCKITLIDKIRFLNHLFTTYTDSWQMMPDLYISQIFLQSYHNVIVWERICDGGKFFCKS
jgi:hypothetical protein